MNFVNNYMTTVCIFVICLVCLVRWQDQHVCFFQNKKEEVMTSRYIIKMTRSFHTTTMQKSRLLRRRELPWTAWQSQRTYSSQTSGRGETGQTSEYLENNIRSAYDQLDKYNLTHQKKDLHKDDELTRLLGILVFAWIVMQYRGSVLHVGPRGTTMAAAYTSQEEVAPALGVERAEREAQEDHGGPQEGRDDDAAEGKRHDRLHTCSTSPRRRWPLDLQPLQDLPGIGGLYSSTATMTCITLHFLLDMIWTHLLNISKDTKCRLRQKRISEQDHEE